MVDILLEAGADLTYENAVGTYISQNVIINVFQLYSTSVLKISICVRSQVLAESVNSVEDVCYLEFWLYHNNLCKGPPSLVIVATLTLRHV
jgi:hypothetical protein